MDARESRIIELVKAKHEGQTRAEGRVPVFTHLARVHDVLAHVLESEGEGDADERRDVALAGYGHDTLEDTDVTEDELRAVFGERSLAYIKGMTNEQGDHEQGTYVAQVCGGPEGVRLVKLADLYDNCLSVTYTLFTLGTEWCDSFFLPIVDPMIARITATEFATYPKSAARLKAMVRTAYAVLRREIERYRETGR